MSYVRDVATNWFPNWLNKRGGKEDEPTIIALRNTQISSYNIWKTDKLLLKSVWPPQLTPFDVEKQQLNDWTPHPSAKKKPSEMMFPAADNNAKYSLCHDLFSGQTHLPSLKELTTIMDREMYLCHLCHKFAR